MNKTIKTKTFIIYVLMLFVLPMHLQSQSTNYGDPGKCDELKTESENYVYTPELDWCNMENPTAYTECMCEAQEYRQMEKGAALMDEVNKEFERAKNLEKDYYDLLEKAWDTENEQYAHQAVEKIKEARKYVGEAYTKYKAYHNQRGLYTNKLLEAKYTNLIMRYDEYIANAENTIEDCCPAEENVIKLTGQQIVELPENYDSETANEEDFWVYGDNVNGGNSIIEINGKTVDLSTYEYHFFFQSHDFFWEKKNEGRLAEKEFLSSKRIKSSVMSR